MEFAEKLKKATVASDSLVCVGLDTDPAKLPAHLSTDEDAVFHFNEGIVNATSDLVCAYKPNSAFYEAMGRVGVDILIRTCKMVPSDVPVILDVKRGDIGNTAQKYAEYSYDIVGADAVTVNPYMGFDAVSPFLRAGKCVFLLCLTSNPSADDFQMLDTGSKPLYERVAEAAAEWAKEGEIGLVVGATKPDSMKKIRDIVGDMPILVPGIGAQGGDVKKVIDECGGQPGTTVINSSRGILYASSGEDYADAAHAALLELRTEINKHRNK